MSRCVRMFCPHCGDEMIHRDRRGRHEASSALNQVIHNNGPVAMTIGDLDTYVFKRVGRHASVRLIEHKQPGQQLRGMQGVALGYLDACLRHAAQHGVADIAHGSGVYVMRGEIGSLLGTVDFLGPQTITSLAGNEALRFAPNERGKFWDWLCCGVPSRTLDGVGVSYEP